MTNKALTLARYSATVGLPQDKGLTRLLEGAFSRRRSYEAVGGKMAPFRGVNPAARRGRVGWYLFILCFVCCLSPRLYPWCFFLSSSCFFLSLFTSSIHPDTTIHANTHKQYLHGTLPTCGPIRELERRDAQCIKNYVVVKKYLWRARRIVASCNNPTDVSHYALP